MAFPLGNPFFEVSSETLNSLLASCFNARHGHPIPKADGGSFNPRESRSPPEPASIQTTGFKCYLRIANLVGFPVLLFTYMVLPLT